MKTAWLCRWLPHKWTPWFTARLNYTTCRRCGAKEARP